MSRLPAIAVLSFALVLSRAPAQSESAIAEAMIVERGCTNCHVAEGPLEARLRAPRAPDLADASRRFRRESLRRLVDDPLAVRPWTFMPRLLGDRGQTERAAAIEALLDSYATAGGFAGGDDRVLSSDIEAGARLFDGVGCRACHRPEDLRGLAGSTAVRPLAAFLADPLRSHPSGRMPDLRLDAAEAQALARFLLAAQAGGEAFAAVPGLAFDYLEGDFDAADASLSRGRVIESGSISGFDISKRRRDDGFAFRFRGTFEAETTGTYRFGSRSDDGSWIRIDGRMVTENPGEHPVQERWGTVELEAGRHGIEVTFCELAGGESLEVLVQLPDGWTGPLPPALLSHAEGRLRIAADAERPSRAPDEATRADRALCSACHDPVRPEGSRFTAFQDLDGRRGCLADRPAPGLPDFGFDAAARDRLRRFLARRAEPAEAASPEHELEIVTHRFGCLTCHERDRRGGLADDLRPYFRSTADLGDQARFPPRLTGVGRKLTAPWFEKVLATGASVRPYMSARMPRFFGPGSSEPRRIAATFAAQDLRPEDDFEPSRTPEIQEAGRTLVGRQGFSCIVCHDHAGRGNPRIHAVDLATVGERIRPMWHRQLLLDPESVNPGTRMVKYWREDKVDFPEILGGDPIRQADSVWAYLAGSPRELLPQGLVFDQSRYQLLPQDEPIVFGCFMAGLSPRVLAVGFPHGPHYAFDAENLRLAWVWRGSFMNAKGTWHERAGALERPDSLDRLQLPPGPPLAELDSDEAPWPQVAGRAGGFRYLGQRRAEDRRPIFAYRQGKRPRIEEDLAPAGPQSHGLLRRIRIAPGGGEKWRHRALVAPAIEERGPGRWSAGDGGERLLRRGSGRLRRTADGMELILTPDREADGTLVLELEIDW